MQTAGAINIVIDVTKYRQAAALLEQAYRCRRLASGMSDLATTRKLSQMADEYEAKALDLETSAGDRIRLGPVEQYVNLETVFLAVWGFPWGRWLSRIAM